MKNITKITVTIEYIGKSVEQVQEHWEDVAEEVEAMFEMDLESSATIDSVAVFTPEVPRG